MNKNQTRKKDSNFIILATRINKELIEFFNDFEFKLNHTDKTIINISCDNSNHFLHKLEVKEGEYKSKRSSCLEYFIAILLLALIWIFYLYLFKSLKT